MPRIGNKEPDLDTRSMAGLTLPMDTNMVDPQTTRLHGGSKLINYGRDDIVV